MRTDEIIEKIRKYGVRRLARETSISEHTIYGWTNKDKELSKRLLSNLAKHFGVEIGDEK